MSIKQQRNLLLGIIEGILLTGVVNKEEIKKMVKDIKEAKDNE